MNFHENPSSGNPVALCGQTKIIMAFCNFPKAAKKSNLHNPLDTDHAKPSQSVNWGAETRAKRKSTSPCLLAIPALQTDTNLNHT